MPAGTFTMGTDADAIAALEAQSPPPWVSQEFPSEQPAHEVTLTSRLLARPDRGHERRVRCVRRRRRLHGPGELVRAGLGLAAAAGRAGRSRSVPRRRPGPAATLHQLVRGGGLRHVARGALPTEAQWEFAARGPDSTVYPWGDEWDPTRANVVDSTGAVAVGSFPTGASWVGALDLSGNAMEWVADWLAADYYATSPAEDPTGPDAGPQQGREGRLVGQQPVRRAVGIPALRGSAELPGRPYRVPGRLAVGRAASGTRRSRSRRRRRQRPSASSHCPRRGRRPGARPPRPRGVDARRSSTSRAGRAAGPRPPAAPARTAAPRRRDAGPPAAGRPWRDPCRRRSSAPRAGARPGSAAVRRRGGRGRARAVPSAGPATAGLALDRLERGQERERRRRGRSVGRHDVVDRHDGVVEGGLVHDAPGRRDVQPRYAPQSGCPARPPSALDGPARVAAASPRLAPRPMQARTDARRGAGRRATGGRGGHGTHLTIRR